MTSVSVYILIDYTNIFINGYTPTDWVGYNLGYTYYGAKAIYEYFWKNIIYVPYLIINFIVLIIYKIRKNTINNGGVKCLI